jgi:hypothetical protein
MTSIVFYRFMFFAVIKRCVHYCVRPNAVRLTVLLLCFIIVRNNKQLFTKGELKMQDDVVEIFRKHGLLDKIIKESRNEAREEVIRETTAKVAVESKTDAIFRVFSARFKSKPKTLRTKISRIKNTNRLNELIRPFL